MLPANRACVLCFAALIGTACAAEGEVAIELILPEDEMLSPASLPIGEVTLIRTAPGEIPTRIARSVQNHDQGLDMGRILPGDEIRLALELRSPSERLIGYGRTTDPLYVDVSEDARIPIHVRRPFLYAGALPARAPAEPPDGERPAITLQVVDPTGTGLRHAPPILDVRGPASVEVSASGIWLAAASPTRGGGELRLIHTADHVTPAFPGIAPIQLPAAPDDIAISPSGRFVVVAHRRGAAGSEGGISIVDLTPAGQEEPVLTFVQIGATRQVAIAASGEVERVLALVDDGIPDGQSGPGDIGDCENPGTVQVVPVVLSEAPLPEQPLIERIGIIADMALGPDKSSVLVADPCRDVVERVSMLDRSDVTDVISQLAGVSTLAVSDTRLWAIGTLPSDIDKGARLLVAAADLGGEVTVTEVPIAPMTTVPIGLPLTEEQIVRQIRPAKARAWSLSVLPGEQLLALNLFTYAYSEGLIFSEDPSPVPPLGIETYEHVLFDTRTGALAERLRTSCVVEVLLPESLFTWVCSDVANQTVSEISYIPKDIAVLFGAE